MIFTLHGIPLARGQGLCDIDRVTQKNFKKWEPLRGEIRPIIRVFPYD